MYITTAQGSLGQFIGPRLETDCLEAARIHFESLCARYPSAIVATSNTSSSTFQGSSYVFVRRPGDD